MFRKVVKYVREKFIKKNDDTILLAIGKMLTNQQLQINSTNINDYEFKIFSQFGDDGIIQYLIKNLYIENQTFIEFGVGDYSESNTRFLMMNNNWSGFIMDGDEELLNSVKKQNWFWKYSLNFKTVFIKKENINDLLFEINLTNLGLLHIDIDGNDYHILKEMDFAKLNPSILILEYNSLFGENKLITVPYEKSFVRSKSHYSNLYFGASLPALNYLAAEKGYALVGCNNAGNNAFFIKRNLLNSKINELSVNEAFKESKFREALNKENKLLYISREESLKLIKGLEVINVETNLIEYL